LAPEAIDGIIISTSGFSLSVSVYKVNCCESEKRILPLHVWMAMKHARKVGKCNSFERVYNRVGDHVLALSTSRTRTGSSNVSQSTALCRTL